jgi:hypothetical protein
MLPPPASPPAMSTLCSLFFCPRSTLRPSQRHSRISWFAVLVERSHVSSNETASTKSPCEVITSTAVVTSIGNVTNLVNGLFLPSSKMSSLPRSVETVIVCRCSTIPGIVPEEETPGISVGSLEHAVSNDSLR